MLTVDVILVVCIFLWLTGQDMFAPDLTSKLRQGTLLLVLKTRTIIATFLVHEPHRIARIKKGHRPTLKNREAGLQFATSVVVDLENLCVDGVEMFVVKLILTLPVVMERSAHRPATQQSPKIIVDLQAVKV